MEFRHHAPLWSKVGVEYKGIGSAQTLPGVREGGVFHIHTLDRCQCMCTIMGANPFVACAFDARSAHSLRLHVVMPNLVGPCMREMELPQR
jgi:hypothetical protein